MSSRSLIGQTVGKYQVVENLGRGGMAEVYKAYQETLDRYVAIKVMHSFLADEKGFLGRFQREARAMAALNHPNIVGVYDFDVFEGMYYIVMEFVSGGTLKDRIEDLASKGEALPLDAATRVVLEVADALAYAHARGMVHRDIKPGNIMLTEDGRAVLTDFGIAKILSGPTFTATGAMVGTPAYMSPEQGLGKPGDERSDLYALGVLYYQMATGRLPYDADTPLAVILKHVNEPIPTPTDLNDDIPNAIQNVIIKAMAKEPDERYQSANELIKDLQAAAAVSDLDLTAAFLISTVERSTPPPLPSGVVDATRLATAAATVLGSAPATADATRLAPAHEPVRTEVVVPTPPAPAAPPAEKKSSRRGILLIGLLLLIVAVAAVGIFVFGGLGGDEEPTSVALAAETATETPSPEPSATPTVEPEDTVDVGATAVAAIAATLTAEPTKTPLPTATFAPSQTPTPDLTATFIASCEPEIVLVNSYTFQNEDNSSTPVNVNFEMNWVLSNEGACPLPAGAEWTYVEGEEFDQSGPVTVDEALSEGDETTVSLELRAPASPGAYESSWQLFGADGNPIGSPLTFEVTVFQPSTPTPVSTPTAEASATSAVVGPFGRNLNLVNCVYVGINWQCDLVIQPYGGQPPYTATISDQNPPAVYEGQGPFIHTILWGRCSAWVNNIAVSDSSGQTISQAEYYDPNNYFPGGCTSP
ncbi:MAG: protein kinase [Chloroflexota bacterium]|jgi:serine/threonine protein kinase/methionine-rich copper-binding protein CopC